MQRLRVAAVTMNGLLGRVEENLASLARWTERAAEAGANLVLFPELVVGGHCDPGTRELAEPVPEGASAGEICRLAALHRLFVCAGLAERDGGAVYNTQMVAGPEGFVGAQRKIHLSRDEVLHFQAGTEIDALDLGICRCGIGICYDNWSPEVARLLALKGAEVLLMPHASRMKMWTDDAASERAAAQCVQSFFRRVFPARAYENACYVVAVNQAGRAGLLDCYPPDHPNQPHHAGGCIVIDPFGETVAEHSGDRIEEGMLVADLDPETLAAARAHPNFTVRTRRPEVYGGLTLL